MYLHETPAVVCGSSGAIKVNNKLILLCKTEMRTLYVDILCVVRVFAAVEGLL